MKKFFKDNYIYLLLLVPFIFICIVNVTPDNDIWFLLSNGRYVFANGIPRIDPFTIHEGFDYIMQQWLSSAILWKIYSWFGKFGVLSFVMLGAFLLTFIYYKLCFLVSENRKISVIVTMISMLMMSPLIVSRPQLLTYIVFVTEIYCLELFIKKDSWKYLIPLVFLSILEINLHSMMWWFLFVVLVPYFSNCISIKNVTVDKVKFKLLLIVTILMILVGFINPYGYKNMTILIYSTGNNSIDALIGEMKQTLFEAPGGKKLIISLICYFVLLNYKNKSKLDIRHLLLFAGFTFLAFLHLKATAYYFLIIGFILAYQFRKVDLDKLGKKYLKKWFNSIKIIEYALFILLAATAIYSIGLTIAHYSWGTFNTYPGVVEEIEKEYKLEDVRLYAPFNDGGYFEYKGIKVYIDPRAEVFLKKFNHKKDVFDEYYALEKARGFNFEKFLDDYHFTHLFVEKETNLYDYLLTRDDYKIIYNEYLDAEQTYIFKSLFVYTGE